MLEINLTQIDKLTRKQLKKAIENCFEYAPEASPVDRLAILQEAQFYTRELERRDDSRISNRDFLLEIVVIILIGMELWFGIYEGNKQSAILDNLQNNSAATAATLSLLESTTESMNRAAQRQAGALSEVAVDITYYDSAIVITNTGQLDLALRGYNFDGERGPKMNPARPLARGDSYKVVADEITEALKHYGRGEPTVDLPFRVSVQKKDGTQFGAESLLHVSQNEKILKVEYGPTSLTEYTLTAPSK
jgi:hypothetical protein